MTKYTPSINCVEHHIARFENVINAKKTCLRHYSFIQYDNIPPFCPNSFE